MTNLAERYDSVVEFVRDLPKDVEQIALCSSSFIGKGGASRVIEQQARDLIEAGYEVTIFALEADIDPPEGVKLVVNGRSQMGLVGRLYRLCYPATFSMMNTISELRKFDLAICHRYPATVAGYLSSTLSNMKYVYWFHHVVEPSKFAGLARVWISILHHLELKSKSVQDSDYLCSVSSMWVEKLREETKNDPIIVPNKIDESRFKEIASLAEVESEFNIKEKELIVLFVGRITEQKNIHNLISIFNSISSTFPNARLVVAGNPSNEAYSQRLRELSGENIVFTGYIEDRTLGRLYKMADVYVTCSLSEAWSLPPMEANFFDTPVVAFENNESARSIEGVDLVPVEEYSSFKEILRNQLDEYMNNS